MPVDHSDTREEGQMMIETSAEAYNAPLSAYTTAHDRTAVYAAARAEGLSVSTWLRRTVREALKENES